MPSVIAEREYALPENRRMVLQAFELADEREDLSRIATRCDFAQILAKIAFVGDITELVREQKFQDVPRNHNYYNEITALYELGISVGNTNGEFLPDEDIRLSDALVMIMRMIGYGKIDIGISLESLALQKRMTSGVASEGGKITLYDALMLAYNALMTDMSDLGTDRSNSEAVTYMEKKLSVFSIKGVVSDDGKNSLTGKSKIGKSRISVGEDIFENRTGNTQLLGLRISGFYHYDADIGEYVLFYADAGGNLNNVLNMYSDNVMSYSNSVYEYYYDEFSSKTSSAKAANDAVVIYNGRAVTINDNLTREMMIPDTGTIKLCDNNADGIYDVIFIYSYQTGVAKYADTSGLIITFKNDIPVLDMADMECEIVNADGDEIAMSTITENSVLSIAESLDNEFVKIIVSTAKSTDTLLEIGDDYVQTGLGGRFVLNSAMDSKYLVLGNSYTFFFDAFNRLAYALTDASASDWRAGVLINTFHSTKGMEDSYLVRVLTVEGETCDLSLHKKMRIFTPENEIVVYNAQEAMNTYFAGYDGMLRFRYNYEEEMTEVEFPLNYGVLTDNPDRLNMIYETAARNSGTLNDYYNLRYRSNYKSLGGVTGLGDNTVVIMRPVKKADWGDASKYSIGRISLLINSRRYGFKSYATKSGTKVAQYLVVWDVDQTGSAVQRSDLMALTGVSDAVDAEGNHIKKIRGIVTGRELTYTLEDESLLIKGTSDGENVYYAPGDVVTMNTLSGKVISIARIYDADGVYENEKGTLYGTRSGGPYAGISPYAYSMETSTRLYSVPQFDSTKTVILGYLYSYADGFLTVTTQKLRDGAEYAAPDIYNSTWVAGQSYDFEFTCMFPTNASYIDYISNDGVVMGRKAEVSDLKPYTSYAVKCSRVLIISASGNTSGVFILND